MATRSAAERTVYRGYAPVSATALYTFEGTAGQFDRVLRIRCANTDSSIRKINVHIVPAGGTLTDAQYAEVSGLALAAAGDDKSVLEYEPESVAAGMKLAPGEAIVIWSDAASKVAVRIETESERD